MSKEKIGLKWLWETIPARTKIGLFLSGLLASFEGVINGLVFGYLVKVDYHDLTAIFKVCRFIFDGFCCSVLFKLLLFSFTATCSKTNEH